MNIQMISNVLLEIFYIIVGLLMLNTAIDTLKDQEHKTRIGTAIFWTILSIIFIAGAAIPPVVVGALLLVIGVLTASKQVNIGNLKMPNVDFAEIQAEKLKNKIFLPSIVMIHSAILPDTASQAFIFALLSDIPYSPSYYYSTTTVI